MTGPDNWDESLPRQFAEFVRKQAGRSPQAIADSWNEFARGAARAIVTDARWYGITAEDVQRLIPAEVKEVEDAPVESVDSRHRPSGWTESLRLQFVEFVSKQTGQTEEPDPLPNAVASSWNEHAKTLPEVIAAGSQGYERTPRNVRQVRAALAKGGDGRKARWTGVAEKQRLHFRSRTAEILKLTPGHPTRKCTVGGCPDTFALTEEFFRKYHRGEREYFSQECRLCLNDIERGRDHRKRGVTESDLEDRAEAAGEEG